MVIEQPRTSLSALGERRFDLKAERLVNGDRSSCSHWTLRAIKPVAHLILLQFPLWIKKGRLKHITKSAYSTTNNHEIASTPPSFCLLSLPSWGGCWIFMRPHWRRAVSLGDGMTGCIVWVWKLRVSPEKCVSYIRQSLGLFQASDLWL